METIGAAKKALEKKIISNEYVTSIGTRQFKDESFIEIGVSEEQYIKNINTLLKDGEWWGYKVKVIIRPHSSLL